MVMLHLDNLRCMSTCARFLSLMAHPERAEVAPNPIPWPLSPPCPIYFKSKQIVTLAEYKSFQMHLSLVSLSC